MTDSDKLEQHNSKPAPSAEYVRALQFNKPRMLTKPEIESLRQDKIQAHNLAKKILIHMEIPKL